MNKFAIITNKYKDEKQQLAKNIAAYIEQNGGKCSIHNNVDECTGEYREIPHKEIPEGVECVITIGGDGTLLHAAKDLKSKDVVFIGVNKGTLGFLAEIHQDQVEEAMNRLLKNQFHVESRMMLEGEVIRKDEVVFRGNVLNEIVIHRGRDFSVTTLEVFVNQQMLGRYSADGMIYSTPTGSTAYNLSAGGPVARPDSKMIIMTPICPHSIGGRSIIFSKKDVLETVIGPAKHPNIEGRTVIFDGDSVFELVSGDIIRVQMAVEETKIAKLDDSSFLQAIKDKIGD